MLPVCIIVSMDLRGTIFGAATNTYGEVLKNSRLIAYPAQMSDIISVLFLGEHFGRVKKIDLSFFFFFHFRRNRQNRHFH